MTKYYFWLGEAGGPDLRKAAVWLNLLEDGDSVMVHMRSSRKAADQWIGPGFKRRLARIKVELVEGQFDD